MGLTAPSPLSSPPGARCKWTSTFASSSLGSLPLVPCHHPGPGSNGSRPGAIAPAPAVGNRRPSAPTPMPLTGTAAPGTDPGAESGSGAAVGPEHDARHSFLWPPPEAALGPRLASRLLIAPLVTDRPPLPRRHRHQCLDRRWGLLPQALAPTPGPRAHVPLLRALEANPETGLLPPRYQLCPIRKFSHFSVRGKSEGPRIRDPAPIYHATKSGWQTLHSGTIPEPLCGTPTYPLVQP
jgi:hypothetical protein